METANLILTIVGLIVLLIGIGAFLNPNIARFINAPGAGPRLKASIALITGIVLILIGFFLDIPAS
jgi:hypothetical protein